MSRPIISSNAELWHPRHWQFERNSRLPVDAFHRRRRWSPDAWVVASIVALAVLAFVVCGRPL